MYTPSQWRIAASPLVLVFVVRATALAWALSARDVWTAGGSGGVLTGLPPSPRRVFGGIRPSSASARKLSWRRPVRLTLIQRKDAAREIWMLLDRSLSTAGNLA